MQDQTAASSQKFKLPPRKQDLSKLRFNLDVREAVARYCIETNGVSAKSLSKKYNLVERTIQQDVKRLKAGKSLNSRGRPMVVDEVGKKAIIVNMRERMMASDCPDEESERNMLNEAARQTRKRRGKEDDEYVLSSSSVLRLNKELGIKTTLRPDWSTQPRALAIQDSLNATSHAVMYKSMATCVPAALQLNMDATQFAVNKSSYLKTAYLKDDPEGETKPVKRISGAQFSIFIKNFTIISPFAHSKINLLLANSSMDPDDLKIFHIEGMSVHADPKAIGTICFCKSRAGNAKYFDFISKENVPNFVDDIRAGLHEEDRNKPAFLTMDGEYQQVATFSDPDVVNKLNEKNIICGKGPASCSAVSNECEIGYLFLVEKNCVKYMSNEEIQNQWVESKLQTMFTDGIFKSWRRDQKRNHIQGILRVLRAMQKTVNVPACARPFQLTGRYPFSTERTLENYKIAKEHRVQIHNALPALVDIFNENGQLTDAEMVEQGIIPTINNEGSDKDTLTVSHRRALLLTQKEIIKTITEQQARLTERKKKAQSKKSTASGKKRDEEEDEDEDKDDRNDHADEDKENEKDNANENAGEIESDETTESKAVNKKRKKSINSTANDTDTPTCAGFRCSNVKAEGSRTGKKCKGCSRWFCKFCIVDETLLDHENDCQQKKKQKKE